MGTKIWGPHFWNTIHFVALGYPSEPTIYDKNGYASFYNSLKFALPCKLCAKHYSEKLFKNPVEDHLRNTRSLFTWTVWLHNDVNRSLNKKIWSLERAHNHYLDMLSNDNKLMISLLKICVCVFIIVTIFYLIWSKTIK